LPTASLQVRRILTARGARHRYAENPFNRRTRSSFRWRAELSEDGTNWHKVIEMLACRT